MAISEKGLKVLAWFHRRPKIAKSLYQIWHCGGGTQSAAIGALIVQGKVPKPDFSIICDTGYERFSTWLYLENVLLPELKKVGVEIVRVKAQDFGYIKTSLFNNKQTLVMPTFTNKNESVGKMPNFCTTYWKKDVADNYLRRIHGVGPAQRCNWIGFSLDESRRAVRMMHGKEYGEGQVRLPLIEDVPMRRQQSIALVKEMGWPDPPRSNCYHCPNQSDEEWRSLSKEEFELAVAMEKVARELDPNAFFHSSCVPLDQVKFSDVKGVSCDSGICFT